jgi:hypothetical protein
MKKYTLYEGRDSNDNDMVRDFTTARKALLAFHESKYPYAVVHVYRVLGSDDEDYIDTIAEKRP